MTEKRAPSDREARARQIASKARKKLADLHSGQDEADELDERIVRADAGLRELDLGEEQDAEDGA